MVGTNMVYERISQYVIVASQLSEGQTIFLGRRGWWRGIVSGPRHSEFRDVIENSKIVFSFG